MSGLIDATQIMNFTNAAVGHSVVLDLADCDLLSIAITVSSATGSNILSLGESVDGINFVEVATLTITTPGTTIWHVYPVFSQYKKILYTPGSGAASFTVRINIHTHTIETAGVGIRNRVIGTT